MASRNIHFPPQKELNQGTSFSDLLEAPFPNGKNYKVCRPLITPPILLPLERPSIPASIIVVTTIYKMFMIISSFIWTYYRHITSSNNKGIFDIPLYNTLSKNIFSAKTKISTFFNYPCYTLLSICSVKFPPSMKFEDPPWKRGVNHPAYNNILIWDHMNDPNPNPLASPIR